jgi:hypothetical protein
MSAKNVTGYQGNLNPAVPLVILNTAQESAAINLAGLSLVGIILPAAFTGTALTFEVSDSLAGTYVVLKSSTSGTSLSYTVAQGTYAAIDPKDFYGVQFLKIKSGSAEGADRTLLLSLKGF